MDEDILYRLPLSILILLAFCGSIEKTYKCLWLVCLGELSEALKHPNFYCKNNTETQSCNDMNPHKEMSHFIPAFEVSIWMESSGEADENLAHEYVFEPLYWEATAGILGVVDIYYTLRSYWFAYRAVRSPNGQHGRICRRCFTQSWIGRRNSSSSQNGALKKAFSALLHGTTPIWSRSHCYTNHTKTA